MFCRVKKNVTDKGQMTSKYEKDDQDEYKSWPNQTITKKQNILVDFIGMFLGLVTLGLLIACQTLGVPRETATLVYSVLLASAGQMSIEACVLSKSYCTFAGKACSDRMFAWHFAGLAATTYVLLSQGQRISTNLSAHLDRLVQHHVTWEQASNKDNIANIFGEAPRRLFLPGLTLALGVAYLVQFLWYKLCKEQNEGYSAGQYHGVVHCASLSVAAIGAMLRCWCVPSHGRFEIVDIVALGLCGVCGALSMCGVLLLKKDMFWYLPVAAVVLLAAIMVCSRPPELVDPPSSEEGNYRRTWGNQDEDEERCGHSFFFNLLDSLTNFWVPFVFFNFTVVSVGRAMALYKNNDVTSDQGKSIVYDQMIGAVMLLAIGDTLSNQFDGPALLGDPTSVEWSTWTTVGVMAVLLLFPAFWLLNSSPEGSLPDAVADDMKDKLKDKLKDDVKDNTMVSSLLACFIFWVQNGIFETIHMSCVDSLQWMMVYNLIVAVVAGCVVCCLNLCLLRVVGSLPGRSQLPQHP